jgi:hypothetical protein
LSGRGSLASGQTFVGAEYRMAILLLSAGVGRFWRVSDGPTGEGAFWAVTYGVMF